MKKGIRRLSAVISLVFIMLFTAGCSDKFLVLDPKGSIGQQQLDLMIISTILCLVIIVPVLVLTFVIVWRYRHRPDRKAKYQPDWEHSTKLETIWWSVPIIIIVILAAITVRYTYALEPSKPIEHEAKPMVIQVTSLDWKWLFQYPEQGIATVNYVQFPEDVPVRFELTSDAPMNSFWIPQLGGQVYTMSGMAMTLHLIADEPGTYFGSGANFSGKDFAKMRFEAKATSQQEFDKWVADIKGSSPALTMDGYQQLAKPGLSDNVTYSAIPDGLFQQIVDKYKKSGSGHHHGSSGEAAGQEHGNAPDAAQTNQASTDHENHMDHMNH